MPRQNRVTPSGEIIAASGRGLLMGNRGVLHDERGRIVRDHQVRRWIACRIHYKGRRRVPMTPGTWTALFFLDEATALAAGHRPCAECRRPDYRSFCHAWSGTAASADAIDRRLHAERRAGPGAKRTFLERLDALPDGAFVSRDGRPWLLWHDELHAWSADGYGERRRRYHAAEVTVLTPPSTVAAIAAIAAGYSPGVHPSLLDA